MYLCIYVYMFTSTLLNPQLPSVPPMCTNDPFSGQLKQ